MYFKKLANAAITGALAMSMMVPAFADTWIDAPYTDQFGDTYDVSYLVGDDGQFKPFVNFDGGYTDATGKLCSDDEFNLKDGALEHYRRKETGIRPESAQLQENDGWWTYPSTVAWKAPLLQKIEDVANQDINTIGRTITVDYQLPCAWDTNIVPNRLMTYEIDWALFECWGGYDTYWSECEWNVDPATNMFHLTAKHVR